MGGRRQAGRVEPCIERVRCRGLCVKVSSRRTRGQDEGSDWPDMHRDGVLEWSQDFMPSCWNLAGLAVPRRV